MAVEFPQASDEIRAILLNGDVRQISLKVQEWLTAGRDLTPEQWRLYQDKINGKVDQMAGEMASAVKQLIDINTSDPIAVKLRKVRINDHTLSFLGAVFVKLKEALQWIFTQIKNGIDWCLERMRETFSAFTALFS